MTVAAKSLSPQCQQVLDFMNHYSDITCLDALRLRPRITRLGARSWELRHEHGYEIESKMVTTLPLAVARHTEPTCWVKRYWLVGVWK